jgi:tRNA(fMet)-specific endonuclease VapC
VTLSLDTNVIVELLRGNRSEVRRRFHDAQKADETLVASLIVMHELYFGVARHPDPPRERANLGRIVADLDVWPFEDADMEAAATIRADLQRRGLGIGAYDLLIAGQAFARGWTVVTANKREFDRVEGLNVIDWTAPAD